MLAVVVLVLPVPWRHKSDSSLGLAWGLDRRLIVGGDRVDPPGRYSLLTVGRPALVAELVWARAGRMLHAGSPPGPPDLRRGAVVDRPDHVEPAAATIGLQRAGVQVPPGGVTAAVGGHGPPYSWIRSMAMGSSHGLMVGLTTYAGAVEEDLAAGRHVAGTGRLLGDGTVGTIGGLVAKAGGARRAGADVLLVPARQVHLLDTFDPGDMRVLAVATIDDAIDQLRATAGG